jgi:hypothetical protein
MILGYQDFSIVLFVLHHRPYTIIVGWILQILIIVCGIPVGILFHVRGIPPVIITAPDTPRGAFSTPAPAISFTSYHPSHLNPPCILKNKVHCFSE